MKLYYFFYFIEPFFCFFKFLSISLFKDVACEVDQIRRIVVKYLPFTLKAGNSFTLRIVGPQQGKVQFYSSFYMALDIDSDESYYMELGSIDDIQYKVSFETYLLF